MFDMDRAVLHKTKNKDVLIGTAKYYRTKIKLVCKKTNKNRFTVFAEIDGKLQFVGMMYPAKEELVRMDKEYIHVANLKLFGVDYVFSVLKDGERFLIV